MSNDAERRQSPGRVFLSGVVAGILLVLVGSLAGFSLGGWESIFGAQLLWVMSPLGAAVAAAAAALKKGGTRGRAVGLGIFALFIGVSVGGVMDYALMWMMLTPESYPGMTGGPTDWLWRRHFAVSSFTITAGALLGMMFGRRLAPRREF